jgi:hypothetical protein
MESPAQVAEVTDAEVRFRDARGSQLAHDQLENRPLAGRDERLGQDRGVRTQPHAGAAGEDDRSHRAGTVADCGQHGSAALGTPARVGPA